MHIPNEASLTPNEAVEAAAKALWAPADHAETWDSEHEAYKDYLRTEASNALAAASPHILSAKVAEAKANNDHIVEGGDGYSAGFHYALHCITGEPK